MIEFKHVSKTFHGKKIIDDISFQIPGRRICGSVRRERMRKDNHA